MTDILIIAAHPDDEAIGCGGAMARLAREGAVIHVVSLADGVGARQAGIVPSATDLAVRRQAAERACAVLGTRPPIFGDLSDNRLDTLPLLEIIKIVEGFIEHYRPDTVFTHHAGDLNIDHRLVHQAVATACRPQPECPVRRLLFFEVASSTEWQTPGSGSVFAPNYFIDISDTLEIKRAALQAYEAEMRPWPHSRSLEGIEHLARWRGASVGLAAAEAFVLGREIF